MKTKTKRQPPVIIDRIPLTMIVTKKQYQRIIDLCNTGIYNIIAKQLFLLGINDAEAIHKFCIGNPNFTYLDQPKTNSLYNALSDIKNGLSTINKIPNIEI